MKAQKSGIRTAARRWQIVVPAVALLCAAGASAGTPAPAGANDRLKVPRFVSLRFKTVNVRKGPATRYPIKWVFKKQGLPVEVIRDLDNWRLIRDRRGSAGWVHVRNLTSRRSVVVTVRRNSLHRNPGTKSPVVARLGQGVVARLDTCRGAWCRVRVQNVSGWLLRRQVWGVYAKEKFE